MDDRYLVFNHGYIPGYQQHRARRPRPAPQRPPEPQHLKCRSISEDKPKRQQ